MTAFGGALTDPTKIMGSRIAAYVIDTIVGLGLVVAVFFALDAGNFETREFPSALEAQRACELINDRDVGEPTDGICLASGSTARVLDADGVSTLQVHLIVSGAVFGLINYVLLTAVAGGTVGKLIFGLRVVTARGERAGFGRNLVRWLLFIVDVACCYLPGLLTSFNTKGHRRVGDLVAGTYVVHRSAEGALLHIPGHLTVLNRQDPYVAAAAPSPAQAAPAPGDGIDAPVFDASRNTYVRYDQASGTWFQWDEHSQAWIPAQQ